MANSHGRQPQTDVVFLDPPYRFLRDQPDALVRLARLLKLHHLRPGGTLVFRHDAADSLAFPTMVPYDVRTYGGMAVELCRPATDGDRV